MSMDNSTGFALERVNYSARPLKLTDAEVLQQVYEQCADYADLVDGHPPSSSAAREEFSAVPEGKTLEDKFMFGLFSPANDLVGLLEGIRHYPEEQTWWIGLIMIAPQQRRQALGTEFYKSFERYVSGLGAQQVMLSVVEVNEPGLRFWQQLGFEVTRTTPLKQFGNKTHKLFVMKRPVAPIATA